MRVWSTYVWFSPFGDRNHAAAQNTTVTRSPIKGAQLFPVSFLVACTRVGRTDPFAMVNLDSVD